MKKYTIILFLLMLFNINYSAVDPEPPQVILGPDMLNEPGGQLLLEATVIGDCDSFMWYMNGTAITGQGQYIESAIGKLTIISEDGKIARYESFLNACSSTQIVSEPVTFIAYNQGRSNSDYLYISTKDILPPTISKCGNFQNLDVTESIYKQGEGIPVVDGNGVLWLFYNNFQQINSTQYEMGFNAAYYNETTNAWVSMSIYSEIGSWQGYGYEVLSALPLEDANGKCIYVIHRWDDPALTEGAFRFMRFSISSGSIVFQDNILNGFCCIGIPPDTDDTELLYDGSKFYLQYSDYESVYFRKYVNGSWYPLTFVAETPWFNNIPTTNSRAVITKNSASGTDAEIWLAYGQYSLANNYYDLHAKKYTNSQWPTTPEIWDNEDLANSLNPFEVPTRMLKDCFGNIWTTYNKYYYSPPNNYVNEYKMIKRSADGSGTAYKIPFCHSYEGGNTNMSSSLAQSKAQDALYAFYGRAITTSGVPNVTSQEILFKYGKANYSTKIWDSDIGEGEGGAPLTAASILKQYKVSKEFYPKGLITLNKYVYYGEGGANKTSNNAYYRHKADIKINNGAASTHSRRGSMTLDIAEPASAQMSIRGDYTKYVIGTTEYTTNSWIPFNQNVTLYYTPLPGNKNIKVAFKDPLGNTSIEYDVNIMLKDTNDEVITVDDPYSLTLYDDALIFKTGTTYLINQPLVFDNTLPSNIKTVIFEGGAIIKLAPTAKITFNNDIKCLVQGEPYMPVFFTSVFDDSVGMNTDGTTGFAAEQVPDEATNGYIAALELNNTVENKIDHGKFSYAQTAITASANVPVLRIYNSVFKKERDCAINTYCVGSFIYNNLFDLLSKPNAVKINFSVADSYSFIKFNTFSGLLSGKGLEITRTGTPSSSFYIKHNLFYGVMYPVYSNFTLTGDPFNTNAVVNSTSGLYFINGVQQTNPANTKTISPTKTIFETDNVIKEQGNFFTIKSTDAEISQLKNTVNISLDGEDGWELPKILEKKTTDAPVVIQSNITASKTFSPADDDGKTLQAKSPGTYDLYDIGYHYDHVDYMLLGQQYETTCYAINVTGANTIITIKPGTVFTFITGRTNYYTNKAKYFEGFYLEGGASISSHANEENRIIFTSTILSGEQLGIPYYNTISSTYPDVPNGNSIFGKGALYASAISITPAAGNYNRLRYTTFSGAGYGLMVYKRMDWTYRVWGLANEEKEPRKIHDCYFSHCNVGIYSYQYNYNGYIHQSPEIFNNLFIANKTAVEIYNQNSLYRFVNNTIDRCGTGIKFDYPAAAFTGQIVNNIITNCQTGLSPMPFNIASGGSSANVRYNNFFNAPYSLSQSGYENQSADPCYVTYLPQRPDYTPPGESFTYENFNYTTTKGVTSTEYRVSDIYHKYFLRQNPVNPPSGNTIAETYEDAVPFQFIPNSLPQSPCINTGDPQKYIFRPYDDPQIIEVFTPYKSSSIYSGIKTISGSRFIQYPFPMTVSFSREIKEMFIMDFFNVDKGYHYPIKGLIQITENGRYMEYEDGSPYIPIQHVIYGVGFDTSVLTRIAQLGVNNSRLVMENYFFEDPSANNSESSTGWWNRAYPFELYMTPLNSPIKVCDTTIGKISNIFETCRTSNIYLMASIYDTYPFNVLNWHSWLTPQGCNYETSVRHWAFNPYNTEASTYINCLREYSNAMENNYGPDCYANVWPYDDVVPAGSGCLSNQSDFFTTHNGGIETDIFKAQKRRMDYLIDKWGNSPTIYCWEPMNEADGWKYGWICGNGACDEEIRNWLHEITVYLNRKELDTWGRQRLTTSAPCGSQWKFDNDTSWEFDIQKQGADFLPIGQDLLTNHVYPPVGSDPVRVGNDNYNLNPKPTTSAVDEWSQTLINAYNKRKQYGMSWKPYFDTESGPINYFNPSTQDGYNGTGIMMWRPFSVEFNNNNNWIHFAMGAAGTNGSGLYDSIKYTDNWYYDHEAFWMRLPQTPRDKNCDMLNTYRIIKDFTNSLQLDFTDFAYRVVTEYDWELPFNGGIYIEPTPEIYNLRAKGIADGKQAMVYILQNYEWNPFNFRNVPSPVPTPKSNMPNIMKHCDDPINHQYCNFCSLDGDNDEKPHDIADFIHTLYPPPNTHICPDYVSYYDFGNRLTNVTSLSFRLYDKPTGDVNDTWSWVRNQTYIVEFWNVDALPVDNKPNYRSNLDPTYWTDANNYYKNGNATLMKRCEYSIGTNNYVEAAINTTDFPGSSFVFSRSIAVKIYPKR